MKKNRKWPMRVLLLLAVGIMGVSGWLLYADYREMQQSDEQMDLKPQPVADDARVLDFSAPVAQYPDIAAWLTVDNTAIDYPVVHGGDNDFYLNHTADKKSNAMGALFVDFRNHRDFSDFNTVIYGHSMRLRSDKMFAGLAKFKERAYFDSHSTGTLYLPGSSHTLEIFAVVVVDSFSDFYEYAFDSPGRCQAHLEMIEAKAMFYKELGVTAGDRILTLSTCSYEFQEARTLVIARIAE